MSSQAPERAARLTRKHLLESWSKKTGAESPSSTIILPQLQSEITVGKGVVLARVAGIEINTDGSVTTVDGITLQAGDVVFCMDQLDEVDSGLWVVQADGAPWVRLAGGLEDWVVVVVRGGTTYGGTVWRLIVDITAVVGTDELYWGRMVASTELDSHIQAVATASTYGHVKIDDVTIKKNGSNQLYTVLSGSGAANCPAVWNGTSVLGYAGEIQLGVSDGAISVSPSARIGVSVNQTADKEGLKVVRSGLGSATVPVVKIETLDTGDGTPAFQIVKLGSGAAAGHYHGAHGVATSSVTSGNLTSTITVAAEERAECTSTVAAGFGVRHRWALQSSTTINQDAGAITVEWVVATHSTRTARMKLLVSDATTEREGMRIEATGSAVKVGFFGAAAVVKPSALTAIDNSTVDTTYGTQERDVITNTRTRLSELETKLKNLGLLS